MPVTLSYPGVYIEEVPSGVRTITGVPTSIAAFVGRAVRGPINTPLMMNSFADFERQFGGLALDFPMSYAVRDFFLNGGAQTLVVRLFKTATGDGTARFTIGGLKLKASEPGRWGEKIRIKVEASTNDDIRARLGIAATDALLNLTITDTNTGGRIE